LRPNDGQLDRLPGAGRGVGAGRGRDGVCDPRQPGGPPGDRHAVVLAGPPAVGVRVPAGGRGVPEPDRAVVEGAAVAGAEGPPVPVVAGGRGGRGAGDGVLERAPAPVPLGAPTPAPTQALARRGRRPGRPLTWRMNHLVSGPSATSFPSGEKRRASTLRPT